MVAELFKVFSKSLPIPPTVHSDDSRDFSRDHTRSSKSIGFSSLPLFNSRELPPLSNGQQEVALCRQIHRRCVQSRKPSLVFQLPIPLLFSAKLKNLCFSLATVSTKNYMSATFDFPCEFCSVRQRFVVCRDDRICCTKLQRT